MKFQRNILNFMKFYEPNGSTGAKVHVDEIAKVPMSESTDCMC